MYATIQGWIHLKILANIGSLRNIFEFFLVKFFFLSLEYWSNFEKLPLIIYTHEVHVHVCIVCVFFFHLFLFLLISYNEFYCVRVCVCERCGSFNIDFAGKKATVSGKAMPLEVLSSISKVIEHPTTIALKISRIKPTFIIRLHTFWRVNFKKKIQKEKWNTWSDSTQKEKRKDTLNGSFNSECREHVQLHN